MLEVKTQIQHSFSTGRHRGHPWSCMRDFQHRKNQGSGFLVCKVSSMMMSCRRGQGRNMGIWMQPANLGAKPKTAVEMVLSAVMVLS